MKNKIKICIIMLVILLTGCKNNIDNNEVELRTTVNDLNGEIIRYIDILELKDEEISELSNKNEELKQELEASKFKVESLVEEINTIKKETTSGYISSSENISNNESGIQNQELISVCIEGSVIKISDREDKIPYSKLSINNSTISNYSNGNGEIKKTKRISNKDFAIEFLSDNEDVYYIDKIELFSSKYSLDIGMSVGDTVKDLENYCKETSIIPKVYNDSVYKAYMLETDSESIMFEIVDSKINLILLESQKL